MRRREWFPFSSMQRGGRIHFMTRRECLDSVLKGGRLLPYEQGRERVFPSLLLGAEEGVAPVLFYSQRRRTPSLKRGESDSLLYRDSLSRKRRECFASIQRGGTLLLGAVEGVAPVLFYSQRRRTPSLERERVSCFCINSPKRRQTPSL